MKKCYATSFSTYNLQSVLSKKIQNLVYFGSAVIEVSSYCLHCSEYFEDPCISLILTKWEIIKDLWCEK